MFDFEGTLSDEWFMPWFLAADKHALWQPNFLC